MPIRSRAQRIGDKAEQVCESIVLNAANWIPRRQDRDFGIDLEAELTVLENGTETVTGKIVKIQVKGAAKPKEKDNAHWVRLSKDYLRYASEFRVPVLLVLVDIKTEEALYVWLQEYLLKRPVVDDQFKSILIKIPRDSLLHIGLEGRVREISRGDTDTSRHLALRELVETFSQSSDYHVFRSLLSILKAFEPDQEIWLFQKTLDQLIELGPHAGAWQTQEHSHVLMECVEPSATS